MPVPPLWELECYVEEDGVVPILIFVSGLSIELQAEAEALRRLLEKFGTDIEPNRLTTHGHGVCELSGEHVRVFCKFAENGRVILLDGLLVSHGYASLESIHRKADSV